MAGNPPIPLTIDDLGAKGDGIHLGEREPVYVDRALPGDQVWAQVYRDKDGIVRGDLVEIVEPSPYRQAAPCSHYEHCGGCTLQHLVPDSYREWKLSLVREVFQKQGLRPRRWLNPVFLGGRNRRRATFTALKLRDRVVLGYYRRRSDQVTDVEHCLVADPRLLELRKGLKELVAPFLGGREPVDLFVQLVGGQAELLWSGGLGPRKGLIELIERLDLARLSWRASGHDEIEVLHARGDLVAQFGGLSVRLPPGAFLQPTLQGERALVEAVTAALPSGGGGASLKLADLFSGCGTFSGPMLERGTVDAYESTPSAVQALAKAGGKSGLKAFRRDLFRNPLRRDELNRYDAVVFDPPRAGCPEQAVAMASSRVGTLVGVSCNPATFARDARILCDGGYWLQSLQVVDQFIWSHHVEVVGVFTKRKS